MISNMKFESMSFAYFINFAVKCLLFCIQVYCKMFYILNNNYTNFYRLMKSSKTPNRAQQKLMSSYGFAITTDSFFFCTGINNFSFRK